MSPASGAEQSAPLSHASEARLPLNVATLVFIRDRGIFVLLGLLLVFFSIWDWPYFASIPNMLLILMAASLTAVFAAGVAVGAISGALDLSVPGTAALASCCCGALMVAGYPIWLGLAVGVSIGLVAGFVNGAISLSGLNPLVVTIGTLSVMSGLSSVISGGYTIPGLDDLKFMGTARYFGIPVHVYFMIAVYAAATFFLTATRHGVRLVAVGGNAEAVRRLGLSARGYQMLGFVLCGFLSALAGLMQTALITEASPQASPGIIFQALTAVALAGVSLSGGRGSLPRVMVGAIILATISDGLTVKGVPPYWAVVLTGLLMIIALVADKLLTQAISAQLVSISTLSVHAPQAVKP